MHQVYTPRSPPLMSPPPSPCGLLDLRCAILWVLFSLPLLLHAVGVASIGQATVAEGFTNCAEVIKNVCVRRFISLIPNHPPCVVGFTLLLLLLSTTRRSHCPHRPCPSSSPHCCLVLVASSLSPCPHCIILVASSLLPSPHRINLSLSSSPCPRRHRLILVALSSVSP